MPKAMRRFDAELIREGQSLIGLAKAGEMVRIIAGPGTPSWKQWPVVRLEALYELAFLRMFVAWETFLETTFYRYMCGQASRYGQASPIKKRYRRVVDAQADVLQGQPYIAWYDTKRVIARCQSHIASGRHEAVFNTNAVFLQQLATIRHRIAHGQDDAKKKFDQTTRLLAGREYMASRPGRFLRDWDLASSPQVRWLETLVTRFGYLAGQIV